MEFTQSNCLIKVCTLKGVKEGYCIRHFMLNKPEDEKKEKNKFDYHKLYHQSGWRKLRKSHLSENPLCKSCGAVGNEVDHIIDHKGDLNLFYDSMNLQTLCKPCHSRKTMETIRINGFKQTNEIIEIIYDKTKDVFGNWRKSMGESADNSYLAKLIVRDSNEKKFYVRNIPEAYSIEKAYKLATKTNPIFKTIHEV